MLISTEKSTAVGNEFWENFKQCIIEEKVSPYKLPEALMCFDGRKISTSEEWLKTRRPELLDFYRKKIYGLIPPLPDSTEFRLLRQRDDVLDGAAVRKEIEIICSMNDGRRFSFQLLLYIPRYIQRPVPAFLTLNFYGNHTVAGERDILLSDHWLPHEYRKDFQTLEQREKHRCSDTLVDRDWKYGCREGILRGYAVGTICYESIMPDNGYYFDRSIYQLFHNEADYYSEKRNYGSICAWAWGVSRVIDCLEHESAINSSKIAVVGHSRLGKAALWTGVNDERIALTISNDSGCGGAKLFHRNFGENLKLHAYYRPYWYSLGIQEYADRETELPVDQHELIGMIAPRLVYVASASEDYGADPKGEFLAAWHAGKTYNLFGLSGLECPEEYPVPGTVLHSGSIGFHLRPGKHAFTTWDWDRYFDFADKHLKG